jgi:ABC-type multidrug transport system ATPase subunit
MPLAEGDIVTIGTLTMTLHLSPPERDIQPTTSEATVIEPMEKEAAIFAAKEPTLVVNTPEGSRKFALSKDIITIGRDPASNIVIDDQEVSRNHAKIERKPDGYEIKDLGSTNGLTFESKRIDHKELASGDVIKITGNITLSFSFPSKVPAPVSYHEQKLKQERLVIKGEKSLILGRDTSCDVVLDHPIISRKHARIYRSDSVYYIEDLGSTNGTIVNDTHITRPQKLASGDTIYIGPIKLIFTPEALEKHDQSHDLRIDVVGINQWVTKTVNLLQDISLTIEPNEFVAIVGGSGAGKSTLLKAINGFNPATDGMILISGEDLYSNFAAHRNKFGYVPQEDIIHKELTVYEALDYSARLRLPADTTREDRKKRIYEVLEELDLTERKDLPIKKLSGGQLKRVSIGVELLTDPGLFGLDEATSGLDPGMESQMMKLLRKLSDNGHTIMLVTHATKNVMLCDKVIFLARGGHLAYFGPPDEALDYFGVKDFDQIYERLEKELTPKEWGDKYKKSAAYSKYIGSKMATLGPATAAAPQKPAAFGASVKRISALSQFIILSRRNINIMLRDRVALILMLLLAPAVGCIHFLLWKKGMFDSLTGDATDVVMSLYMLAMIGFIIASLSVMREIVKEADIYRRERMVTLQIVPYVLSKVWVAVLLTLYQSVVFMIVIKIASGWPGSSELLPAFFTIILAVFSAMLAGLFVSAISPNQNVTPLLLILILVPQSVFGGIIPISTFGPAGSILGSVSTTKWSFECLVTISGMGKDVSSDPCWQLPKEQREQLTEEDKSMCKCLGPNIFTECNFPGIRSYYDPSVEQAEPLQPVKPADPPEEPAEAPEQPSTPEEFSSDPMTAMEQMDEYKEEMDAWKEEMDAWKEEAERYKEQVNEYREQVAQYEDDMKVWQDEYETWKESRAKSIGKAEAIIDNVKEQWGPAFNVNLASHWGWLGFIILVTFGLLIGAMKLKDRKR